MDPDDEVCLCFHVSLRKINAYLKRENPPVASLISECLGAGTGCGWCVPILEHLHARHAAGERVGLETSAQDYADARRVYRATSERRNIIDGPATGAAGADDPGGTPAPKKPASPDAGAVEPGSSSARS